MRGHGSQWFHTLKKNENENTKEKLKSWEPKLGWIGCAI